MKSCNKYIFLSKKPAGSDVVNKLLGILICIILFSSCKKLLEVDPPKSLVEDAKVFSDDATALSGVYGIYTNMQFQKSYASGSDMSVTAVAGLSADELIDFARTNATNLEFELNNIRANNSVISSLWESLYGTIYQTNSAMEGMISSTGMTTATKTQLRGECLLVRAFSYFYLTQLFGDVPLVLTTDYEKNAVVSRTDIASVNNQIRKDLTEAIDLLSNNYIALDDDFFTLSRARPNKSAAIALLARVHLFAKEWSKAEEQASLVIANTDLYGISTDLNTVFLKNSREAIWQLRPASNTTNEAYFFINFNPNYNSLSKRVVLDFEPGDVRKDNWVRETNPGDSVFYPFKYKQPDFSGSLDEYSMVIRLAEVYLIRAEAEAQQGNLSAAIADLDEIRGRANLPLIADTNPGISKEDLLLLIQHERRVELFTEWGHRWFDLKRTDRAATVLEPIKQFWQDTDVLYPVPQSEFTDNPFLGLQNQGY